MIGTNIAGDAASSIRVFVRDGIIQIAFPVLRRPMTDLLEQFISQECTPYVRRLLEEAIAGGTTLRPHFEFNRFEITIERAESSVVIEDVLDATKAGVQRIALADFMSSLGRCSG